MSTPPKLPTSQPGLFNNLPGSLDLDEAVARSLRVAFREGSKSREAIAEEMSRLMGRPVTVRMLDNFTAESHPRHRFPAAWLPAFCIAAADTECGVIRLLIEAAGYHMIGDKEAMLIEFARATLAKKEATEKIEELETELRSQR